MEGLSAEESWAVLQHAEMPLRVEIFGFFEDEKQVEIVESVPAEQIVPLIAEMPPDDRVDLLAEVELEVVEHLMPLLPTDERRDILRLSAYPEGTAGAEMTTEFAGISEGLSAQQAIDEVRRRAEELETIYYLYVVDEENHLRGLISFRQLLTARPDAKVDELMERDIVTVNAADDREEVADKVERYDLLAIPVVDDEYHLVGIITHDDVIDVVREEAVEDAHRIAGVEPLDTGYLETGLLELCWKRGVWLTILFFLATLTCFTLWHYEAEIAAATWLVYFIPLLMATGGNSGNQSAALVITALTSGNVTVVDWWRVARRELGLGLLLGLFLGLLGFLSALGVMFVSDKQHADTTAPAEVTSQYDTTQLDEPTEQSEGESAKIVNSAVVVGLTLVLLIPCGTLFGSLLPLLFRRLGLDPALMSNPLVAGMIDVVGIVIYVRVAIWILL
jgi:magnesium transporter